MRFKRIFFLFLLGQFFILQTSSADVLIGDQCTAFFVHNEGEITVQKAKRNLLLQSDVQNRPDAVALLKHVITIKEEFLDNFPRTCVSEYDPKMQPDENHPAVQLAAIAQISKEHRLSGLLVPLVPYIDLQIDSRETSIETRFIKFQPTAENDELFKQIRVYNHPIVDFVLEMGEQSVPSLLNEIEKLCKDDIKHLSPESSRLLLLITVVNELELIEKLSPTNRNRLDDYVINMIGDQPVKDVALIALNEKVRFGKHRLLYGTYMRDPGRVLQKIK